MLCYLFVMQRVVAGKWRNRIDVAVKMMKEGAMNEEDFIAEAQVMQLVIHQTSLSLSRALSQPIL